MSELFNHEVRFLFYKIIAYLGKLSVYKYLIVLIMLIKKIIIQMKDFFAQIYFFNKVTILSTSGYNLNYRKRIEIGILLLLRILIYSFQDFVIGLQTVMIV